LKKASVDFWDSFEPNFALVQILHREGNTIFAFPLEKGKKSAIQL